jgi:hypothetical protein
MARVIGRPGGFSMLGNCTPLPAFAVALLAVIPCFADIVPISTSSQVSAQGGVQICNQYMVDQCGPPVEAFFNYPESLEATASSSWGTITADAQVQYQSNVTAANINVGLQDSADISTPTAIDLINGFVDVTEQFSLEFDLTAPSVVHLKGFTQGFSCRLLFGGTCMFDSQLTLSGPGFQFDSSAIPGGEFDLVSTLEPGIYTLSAVADLRENAIYGDNIVSAQGSLSADFTPVVPEPRWTPIIPAVLIIVGACIFRKARPITKT